MTGDNRPNRPKNLPVNLKMPLRSENLFLSVLPESDYIRLQPYLQKTDLPLGTVIHKPDEAIKYVYFLENSIVSIVTRLEDGSNIETGVIGNEGIAGIGAILSDDVSPRESVVQLAGRCQRIEAQNFRDEFEFGGRMNRLALRFVFAFIAQISQNAVCANRHKITARLARWLLMVHDRTNGDELNITQEYVAQMLGVHRPSVSESASKLQEQDLIKYVRGRITILNRQGLEKTSCECYDSIRQAYDKYLAG